MPDDKQQPTLDEQPQPEQPRPEPPAQQIAAEQEAQGGSVALARQDGPAFLQRARAGYDRDQVRLIKSTVAKGADDATLGMFLELAARYELDPFAKEIWCAVSPGRNGNAPTVIVMVGRDGMLKVAERTGQFEGLQADTVYSNDKFEIGAEKDEEGRTIPGGVPIGHGRALFHSYTSPIPDRRGEIVGAWAVARRRGRDPFYFFAQMTEYMPTNENKVKYSPWGSQKSVMILKCAQTYVLRMLFSITGVVGPEEAERALEALPATNLAAGGEGPPQEPDYGPDEELAVKLRTAMDVLGYRQAKRVAVLAGCKDEADRFELARQLSLEIDAQGGEEEPVDGELVAEA